MSDFKAKMHQILFWLGLCPRPHWGSLQRSPDPLAGFEGPTSKGGEGGKRDGMTGRGGRRDGRGLSGNVAQEAFCLKSAPENQRIPIRYHTNCSCPHLSRGPSILILDINDTSTLCKV